MGRFRLMPRSRYVIQRPVNESARFVFQANAAVRANVAQVRDAEACFGSEGMFHAIFFFELPADDQL